MDDLSLVANSVALTPKEYNVLLAQLASRIANAQVSKGEERTAARNAVLMAIEIMERSGLQAATPQAAPQPQAAG